MAETPPARRGIFWPTVLAPCLALFVSCASYTEATQGARAAYYSGESARAVELWSELLDKGSRKDDAPLLLLERAVVYLAMGRYAEAAKDLHVADQRLEVLDFTGDPGKIGKYLFSEDSGLYRGPPHEKVLAPTLTSLSYAALADRQRANTAANAAFSQMERFANLAPSADFEAPLPYILLGIGAEERGDTQRAYTAYERAYELRPLKSLEPVLLRVLDENAKRFGGHWTGKFAQARRSWGDSRPLGEDEGELVVVVLNGRAPIRAEKDLALDGLQRALLVEASMATIRTDYAAANMVEALRLVSEYAYLPFAVLESRPSRFNGGRLELQDGQSFQLEEALDVERQVQAWYEESKDALVAAALSRLSLRVALRVGTYLVTLKETENELFSLLAQALTGETLKAIDTPDTRCWTLLPKNILFQRRTLPAGQQSVRIEMTGPGGASDLGTRAVQIIAGETAFVVLVVPD